MKDRPSTNWFKVSKSHFVNLNHVKEVCMSKENCCVKYIFNSALQDDEWVYDYTLGKRYESMQEAQIELDRVMAIIMTGHNDRSS